LRWIIEAEPIIDLDDKVNTVKVNIGFYLSDVSPLNTEIIRINYQELRNNSQTESRCFRLYLDIRIFEFCFTTLKPWTFLSRH
jgi:hypothetical protein